MNIIKMDSHIVFRSRFLTKCTILSLLFGLIFSPIAAFGEESNVNPGINLHYQNPDFQSWVNTFERPGREVYDRRFDIVRAVDIQRGMQVADIGAGTGLFTRLFSTRVGPEGRVFAVDISKVFIDNILNNAKQEKLVNIEGVVNTSREVGLPASSIDLAFICDTYHHFEYPLTTLQSIHQALRPDAQLIVIDFRKIQGKSSNWVMNHVRLGKKEAIREIESQGFKLIEDNDFLQVNYFLRFRKI